MKIFILLFAIFGVIYCLKSEYKPNNLKDVQKECEINNGISDAEKQIWSAWKIPTKPTRCQIACIMSAFKWIDKKGNPKVS